MTPRMTLEDARIIVTNGRGHETETNIGGYVYSPAYLGVCRDWLRTLYDTDWPAARVVRWQQIVRNEQWVEACHTIQRHLPVLCQHPEHMARHAFEWYLETGWMQAKLDRPEHEQGWNLDYLWRRLRS